MKQFKDIAHHYLRSGLDVELPDGDIMNITPYVVEVLNAAKIPREIIPIMYDMSDIDKEITHNGETFVPLERLGEIYAPDGTIENGAFGWDVPTGGGDCQDYYYRIAINANGELVEIMGYDPDPDTSFPISENKVDYSVFLQLIEWHFNVFQIENTINKLTYKK